MAILGTRSNPDIIKEPAVAIKIPEIFLLIIAIITFFANNDGSPAYVASVLVPSLINAIVFLTVYVLGYTQLKYTPVELALYSYNVIGLFISSILLLVRSYPGNLVASGIICLFLAGIYCAEIFFSYTALVNRPTQPTNAVTVPAPHQQPVVISTPVLEVHPGAPASIVPRNDTVDLGPDTLYSQSLGNVYHTNPVYPSSMNYPPYPVSDATTLPGPSP
ncbi:uncharacterized protein LOC123517052 [Portunus trituberculatus]|uniref:uncharacterized protein LOC123517052 n=1 Tax=Portunus trituberculatus TaxID=210409 RepID=UPI001E1D0E98|nr:uncharacterized protein LOC123517052 [Portunus trituberculatus]XP_045132815.1 uncharacterized protein LOC123517052 [Portunus trituberculatus]